jgi:hypothetical protein
MPRSKHSINNAAGLTSMEGDQLVQVSADTMLKLKLYDLPLDSFWIYIRNEYPVIANKALDILLLFAM